MSIVRTDLRDTRERARELRFEPTGSITKTDVQKAIEQVASQPPAVAATSIAFANSPYTVLPTDNVIYVDTAGGAITINLQAQSARNDIALIIKDVTGHAATNNITVNPAVGETIDTMNPLTIGVDFGGFTLAPLTGGYTLQP